MCKRSLARWIILFAFLVGLASCGGSGGSGSSTSGWDMSRPAATNVTPQPGAYTFSQMGCFTVSADSRYVVFSSDCVRYDAIPIVNGSFAHTHGEIGGTNCPTDSYSIAGSFTDPTHASGTISYAVDCQITLGLLTFTATKR